MVSARRFHFDERGGNGWRSRTMRRGETFFGTNAFNGALTGV
jgi:hypothetical protein